MTNPNSQLELNIYSFKKWLVSNRKNLSDILRKYKVLRNYIITLSLGGIIFISDRMITLKSYDALTLIGTGILISIILLAPQISSRISGLNGLRALEYSISENEYHWLQNFSSNQVIGSHELLADFWVKKAVQNSRKNTFNTFCFYNAIMIIADMTIEKSKVNSEPDYLS